MYQMFAIGKDDYINLYGLSDIGTHSWSKKILG